MPPMDIPTVGRMAVLKDPLRVFSCKLSAVLYLDPSLSQSDNTTLVKFLPRRAIRRWYWHC